MKQVSRKSAPLAAVQTPLAEKDEVVAMVAMLIDTKVETAGEASKKRSLRFTLLGPLDDFGFPLLGPLDDFAATLRTNSLKLSVRHANFHGPTTRSVGGQACPAWCGLIVTVLTFQTTLFLGYPSWTWRILEQRNITIQVISGHCFRTRWTTQPRVGAAHCMMVAQ